MRTAHHYKHQSSPRWTRGHLHLNAAAPSLLHDIPVRWPASQIVASYRRLSKAGRSKMMCNSTLPRLGIWLAGQPITQSVVARTTGSCVPRGLRTTTYGGCRQGASHHWMPRYGGTASRSALPPYRPTALPPYCASKHPNQPWVFRFTSRGEAVQQRLSQRRSRAQTFFEGVHGALIDRI